MLSNLVRKILQATVYDVAIRSDLDVANKLSQRFNNNIRFKREDTQAVFSFKIRGAYNKISQLSEEEKSRGVVCASAGNHAQGVAVSAHKLNINNVIVMPKTTPDIKVDAVKALGGNVVLHGDSFDVANRYAQQRSLDDGLVYIAPYDDEDVIAGQGTIGQELSQQWRDMEYVFVAVGGGGLISGVAAYLGNVAPHVTVVAVEPAEGASLKLALETGERGCLPQVGLFVDGAAVAQIGALPFEILRQQKSDGSGGIIEDEVVTCSNDEVCAAIKDVFEESRTIVEPAGALAVAGMKKYIKQHGLVNKNCVAIVCGANMNFDRLRYIAERTEIGEKKEAIFAVNMKEEKGAFLQFCSTLQGRSITEFNYRHADLADNSASVFVGIALKDGEKERALIAEQLVENNYVAYDLTDDEMAKTHIRYLIGGHAHIENEQLFRVQFPERPNALLNFLEQLGQNFDITLFHYRNHGAAEGRVLVGLKVAPDTSIDVPLMLNGIGYYCEPVTDNVGYQIFLK